MKSIRDWVFAKLISNSLAPFSPSLSSADTYFRNTGIDNLEDAACATSSGIPLGRTEPLPSDRMWENRQEQSLHQESKDSCESNGLMSEKDMDLLAKVEDLRIKFFRALKRFGLSYDNYLVAKVLYRVHVATLIRSGESDLKRIRNERAKTAAIEQEVSGVPELNYSLRILVLGKTGVGKSSTINSILSQAKSATDAFHPTTSRIHEVSGTVNGINFNFIDTPGLLHGSPANFRRNRKIMLSIRRYIKKSPPDIVLFCERVDLVNTSYSDFHLFKLMNEVFGSAIWYNTIIVLTHASSTLPDGPGGRQFNFESYVSQCTDLIQSHVHQVLRDFSVENPIVLVENHNLCKRNIKGEATLPNGVVWKVHFLLLCICTKMLSDVNNLLDFKDSMTLGPPINPRVASLPHLLSSLLQYRASGPSNVESDYDELVLADSGEEEDYDKLPPIRILNKTQFNKMSRYQKREYLNELDYRETLFLKKQLKEATQKRKTLLERGEEDENDDSEPQQYPPEAVMFGDMAIPPTFDSECPSHRYRYPMTNEQWLLRPVLDPQGWDHDLGFDGINLETATEFKRNAYLSIAGQMSKDKHDFHVQSEFAASYVDARGPSCYLGMDVQSGTQGTVCTTRSNVKFKSLKRNVTDCAVSLTSFGGRHYFGAKVEDAILLGKRVKLLMNGGGMMGFDKMAMGGTVEVTVRGLDYPIRNDYVSLSFTALTFAREMVLGGGVKSEFRPTRGTRITVNCNVNSRKMGQATVKLSTSQNIEFSAIAVLSILRVLMNRKPSLD